MTNFPKQGDWLRWVTETHGREGEVIHASWPSFVVKWLGVEEPQVFPLGSGYFDRPSSEMSIIPAPTDIPQKLQQGELRSMSIAQAAALQETTPKAIRARLRSGKLKGHYKDGRWVGVYI